MTALDEAIGAATASQRPIALDTQILVGFMEGRPEISQLVSGFINAHRLPKIISTVTLAEILTLPAMHVGPEEVLLFCQSIYRIPGLTVIELDREVAIATAGVRTRTGLKLPDAAIIATALVANAVAMLGNDRRWKSKPLGLPYIHINDLLA